MAQKRVRGGDSGEIAEEMLKGVVTSAVASDGVKILSGDAKKPKIGVESAGTGGSKCDRILSTEAPPVHIETVLDSNKPQNQDICPDVGV